MRTFLDNAYPFSDVGSVIEVPGHMDTYDGMAHGLDFADHGRCEILGFTELVIASHVVFGR
jgi:hypothetical protein